MHSTLVPAATSSFGFGAAVPSSTSAVAATSVPPSTLTSAPVFGTGIGAPSTTSTTSGTLPFGATGTTTSAFSFGQTTTTTTSAPAFGTSSTLSFGTPAAKKTLPTFGAATQQTNTSTPALPTGNEIHVQFVFYG